MKKRLKNYKEVPFPKIRRVYSDQPREVQRKHIFHAFVEVDVTKARQSLREHQARTGESLSFTAFIAICLGRAVDEHKSVQAYRKGRNHLILITLGGIGEKPGIVDGHMVIREYLSMTLSMDHDMIDRAPAAHFTQRLKDLIESGYGLGDSTIESEQAVAPGTSNKS